MKVYDISYYLYYGFVEPLKSGSFLMYADDVREIFNKAFDKIKENETENEEREFIEERITGFELQFKLAKNQVWDGEQLRKMTYSLKPKKSKVNKKGQPGNPETEK
jgi:hypothetical protein